MNPHDDEYRCREEYIARLTTVDLMIILSWL